MTLNNSALDSLLIAIEGNDRTGILETKKGDTWVVFDPIKVRFVEEYRVESVGE